MSRDSEQVFKRRRSNTGISIVEDTVISSLHDEVDDLKHRVGLLEQSITSLVAISSTRHTALLAKLDAVIRVVKRQHNDFQLAQEQEVDDSDHIRTSQQAKPNKTSQTVKTAASSTAAFGYTAYPSSPSTSDAVVKTSGTALDGNSPGPPFHFGAKLANSGNNVAASVASSQGAPDANTLTFTKADRTAGFGSSTDTAPQANSTPFNNTSMGFKPSTSQQPIASSNFLRPSSSSLSSGFSNVLSTSFATDLAAFSPPPSTGTAHIPFKAEIERDINGTESFYQSISFVPGYIQYSPEELRVADYVAGRQYGTVPTPTSHFCRGATDTTSGSPFGKPIGGGLVVTKPFVSAPKIFCFGEPTSTFRYNDEVTSSLVANGQPLATADNSCGQTSKPSLVPTSDEPLASPTAQLNQQTGLFSSGFTFGSTTAQSTLFGQSSGINLTNTTNSAPKAKAKTDQKECYACFEKGHIARKCPNK